jgi:hypothetical protein
MTEIVLFLWVITSGDIALTQIDGFLSMEACEAAAESFTENNPKKVNDIPFGMVAKCEIVPK